MTPQQKKALQYLKSYWSEKGYSPSYREISSSINSGVSHTHEIIDRLVRKGFVHVDRGMARSIYPIEVWQKLRGEVERNEKAI
jgi:SOS-response transcriptional repressor LexA